MASPTTDWFQALQSLSNGLIHVHADDVEVVERTLVPAPFSQLLVHNEHMTTTLEAFHHAALQLMVLRHEQDADSYRRMILLHRTDSQAVVEFGIVRIHLACLDAQVREEILRRERPLGEILIRHNVLRRIEPKWFVRFDSKSAVAAYFPRHEGLYGRIGIIHYDGHPAIELLEVVCG